MPDKKNATEIKRLIRIGIGVNFIFFILCVFFIVFFGYDASEQHEVTRKLVSFTVANLICWIINLLVLYFLVPLFSRYVRYKTGNFFVPSFVITCGIALFVSRSPLISLFADKPLNVAPLLDPLYFICCINTFTLICIELTLTNFERSDIRLENARIHLENAALTHKSLQAKHDKLISQLHPHFLFNSLNALNSLIRRNADEAEAYLIMLSDFLRFSISHNEQNLVLLKDELKFALSYLEMQKIRFGDALLYIVDVPPEEQLNMHIPVFSLQLLLENAVKHNKLTKEMPLRIDIRFIGRDQLIVKNNIQEKPNIESRAGVGLKNLSDRYLLLKQPDIKILNDGHDFQVSLKLITP